MHYNCRKKGKCFNRVMRPKIEVFNGIFPRGSGFGDVDGWVVLRGYGIGILEWKSADGHIKPAQRDAFVQFTEQHRNNIVWVVWGNAETMEIETFLVVKRGQVGRKQRATLAELKTAMADWGVGAKEK